jgi:polyisoprenoid-binding protein YceI
MKSVKLSVVLLLLTVITVFAATTWRFDPSHTKIGFTATHMKISEVNGQFKEYDGTIRTGGKKDFSNAEIEISIDATSIDTDNKKRDKHLKGEDFFNTEKYPAIRFESKSLAKVEGDEYRLKGDLTIRGTTQEETFTAIYNGTVTGMRGKTRSGWQITGAINRFDYGVQWDKTLDSGGLVVGKEVDINCDVELIEQ